MDDTGMLATCPACRRPVGQRSILEHAATSDLCAACKSRRPATVGAGRLSADTLAILRAIQEVAPDFQVVIEPRRVRS